MHDLSHTEMKMENSEEIHLVAGNPKNKYPYHGGPFSWICHVKLFNKQIVETESGSSGDFFTVILSGPMEIRYVIVGNLLCTRVWTVHSDITNHDWPTHDNCEIIVLPKPWHLLSSRGINRMINWKSPKSWMTLVKFDSPPIHLRTDRNPGSIKRPSQVGPTNLAIEWGIKNDL